MQKLMQSTWLLSLSQNQGITNSLSFLIHYLLVSLKNRKFDNPLIIKILSKLENLSYDNDV